LTWFRVTGYVQRASNSVVVIGSRDVPRQAIMGPNSCCNRRRLIHQHFWIFDWLGI